MSRANLIQRVAGFYPGDSSGEHELPGEMGDDPQEILQIDNLTREVKRLHKYMRQRGLDATAQRDIRNLSREFVPPGAPKALHQSLELLALQEIQHRHLLDVLSRV
jgi:hypothetical protein